MHRVVLLIVTFSLLHHQLLAADILPDIRMRNRQAIESIHTLSCNIELKATIGEVPGINPPQDVVGTYWKSGKNRGWKSEKKGAAQFVVTKNGICSSISEYNNSRGKLEKIGVVEVDSVFALGNDAFYYGCMHFIYNKNIPEFHTFDELLNLDKTFSVVSCEKLLDKDQAFFVVKTKKDLSNNKSYWFDPNFNYLICKVDYGDPAVDIKTGTTVVKKFTEAAPGIFFPEQIQSKFYKSGKLLYTENVVFKNIKINHIIDDNQFECKFTNGLHINDTIKGTTYTWGKEDLTTKVQQPGPPSSLKKEVKVYKPTVEEPNSSFTNYILIISTLVVIISISLRYFLRR